MNSKCINIQTIADYLSGNLREQSVENLELHLAGCSRCRELVVLSKEMIDDPELMPSSTMSESEASQIIENLPLSPGIVESVKKRVQNIKHHVQDQWRDFKDQWQLGVSPNLAYAPVSVRSGMPPKDLPKRLSVPLFDHRIDFVILPAGNESCHLHMKVISDSDESKSCRIILTDATNNTTSRMSENCEMLFENIPCGECQLQLFQNGQPAGKTKIYTGRFQS